MGGERQYRDVDGNPVSLDTLCRKEPEWAANRIRVLEQERAAMLKMLRQYHRAEANDLECEELLARMEGDV